MRGALEMATDGDRLNDNGDVDVSDRLHGDERVQPCKHLLAETFSLEVQSRGRGKHDSRMSTVVRTEQNMIRGVQYGRSVPAPFSFRLYPHLLVDIRRCPGGQPLLLIRAWRRLSRRPARGGLGSSAGPGRDPARHWCESAQVLGGGTPRREPRWGRFPKITPYEPAPREDERAKNRRFSGGYIANPDWPAERNY